MDSDARAALKRIRACLRDERYRLAKHFMERMDQRGFFWADLLHLVDTCSQLRDESPDRFGREKWVLCGLAPDNLSIEIVCTLEQSEDGDWAVFITIYEE